MTYYLKYRPKTIDELDLTSVRERLKRIVDSGKFAHAYLFAGPRGTGKTSAARLMAQAAGVSPIDILEMDAASNRGIDDVRELRERVGLSPAAGDKKCYIIDEVHMLTAEAHNALLKTLEEPPPHVIFFLCTTEFDKLPATVVSRCVKVDFTLASPEEVARSLKRVVSGEKLKIKDELVASLAKEAGGSFREIHTVLEEAALAAASDAAGAAGGEILDSHLAQVKSSPAGSTAEKLADCFIAGDSGSAINIIESCAQEGIDFSRLAVSLLEILRQRLIQDPSPRLLTVAKTVDEKVRAIRYAPLPQLTLEIAALELAIPGHSEQSGESSRESGKTVKQYDSEAVISKTVDGKPVNHSTDIPSHRSTGPRITLDQLLSKWPAILAGVRQKNHGIVTLLSHCRPTDCADGAVNIAVKYKFHRDQLAQDRFRRMIEAAAAEVLGSPLRLRFNLSPQTIEVLKKSPQDDNIAAIGDNELVSTVEELFS